MEKTLGMQQKRVGAGTSALGIGMSILLLAGCGGSSQAEAINAKTSAPAATVKATTAPPAPTREEIVQSLEMPASDFMEATPNEIGKAILNERLTAWLGMGVTKKGSDTWLHEKVNGSDSVALKQITDLAKSNAAVATEAMLVADYGSNEYLQRFRDRFAGDNGVTIQRKYKSFDETHPYRRTIELDGDAELVSGSIASGQARIHVKWKDTDNAEFNNISRLPDYTDQSSEGFYTMDLVVVDGLIKIADVKDGKVILSGVS